MLDATLTDRPLRIGAVALAACGASGLAQAQSTSGGANPAPATVRLFQRASGVAKDADVKAFAGTTLRALQHHLQMAEALKVGVAGKS